MLHLSSITALLALASLSDASPPKGVLRPRQDSPYVNAAVPSGSACPSGVHVIAASGQGSADVGGYGLISSLVTDIVGAIPGSTNVSLTYPKSSTQNLIKIEDGVSLSITDTSSRHRKHADQEIKSDNLLAYLPEYHSACPDTAFVLLGYSAVSILNSA